MVRRTACASSSVSNSSSTQTPSQLGSQVIGQAAGVAATQSGAPVFPVTQHQPIIPLLTTNALVGFSRVPGNLDCKLVLIAIVS